ncbi:OLC1v1014114C1 [Oldenlandia corymbosa var. corymbosa]|uniref:OLC1v1014114C1 n=1 Tax=Oldenlandia corymbosa var. corymbosa TaxID=529605 RepID=A0AAV1E0B6_OLDCO|nr:OLC1v1014114C1 [Oldenlandia corymbosa var. corymbosa]
MVFISICVEFYEFLFWNTSQVVHFLDKFIPWHRLPVLLGLAYLGIRRHLHQRYNLLHVGNTNGRRYDPGKVLHRTPDGSCNHPTDDKVGSFGTFFGRNMPPSTSQYGLLDPHPAIVASKLMERRNYVDCGKQLNMIACSWIQFMIHDWVDHMEDTNQIELRAPDEVAGSCPLKSFKFFKNKRVATGSPDLKFGFLNSRTPWWDGSVIYGNNNEGMVRVRTFVDGKLKISSNGLLEHDDKGIPVSGDIRNGWAGFSVLQALFIKEHNAVCDMLKENYPDLDDEKLYRHARLVTSAVIAKVHTIDWTLELLKTDTLTAGMRINWYGFFGKKIKDLLGHKFGHICSGLVGLKKPMDHGIPYSLTEEFVSVYRMHSLLPDKILLRDTRTAVSDDKCPPIHEEIPMTEMIGKVGEERLSKIGMERMLVTMGHQASGAVTLRNYPAWMRNLIAHDENGAERADPVDLAALEIYRDRERGVPRYNEFRRNLLMIPISKWEDLTDDADIIQALKEVYGDDVNKLDLQVGLHAEKKIKGFAIGETAFFIFLLIASRRLEADRFFTTNFNSVAYTEKGLEWVNTTETLKDVIDRHFPEMTKKWMRSTSAFSVWHSEPNPKNYVPLYLRLAP